MTIQQIRRKIRRDLKKGLDLLEILEKIEIEVGNKYEAQRLLFECQAAAEEEDNDTL